MIPLVGFLPPRDPRMVGTVEAISRELTHDGLVQRYLTGADGRRPAARRGHLPHLLVLAGRQPRDAGRWDEAGELFEHLLALRNDVGLLAEEYDPTLRRQLGNFPQAFSHVGLINSAHNLSARKGPAEQRAEAAASAEA